MSDTIVLRSDRLRAAVQAIVAAAGSAPGEAAQVADNLVEANLRGHDSHGVGMVPRYVDAVLEGGLAVNAHVAVRMDSGPLLTLDGKSGYGQVIGAEAMALGTERAKAHGVCVSAGRTRPTRQDGRGPAMLATAGLVLSSTCWRGRSSRLRRPLRAPRTNPFCVGIGAPAANRSPRLRDPQDRPWQTRSPTKGDRDRAGTLIDDAASRRRIRLPRRRSAGALLLFGGTRCGPRVTCERSARASAGGATGGP